MEEENERFSEIEARVEAIEEVTISYLSSFRQELSDIKSSLATLEENTIQKTDKLETDVKSIKTNVSKLEDKITLPKSNQTKRILIDDELSPPPAKRLSLTPTTTSIGNVLSDDEDETPSTSKRLSLTSLKKTPTLTPSPSSHYSIPKTLADLSIPVQQKLQPFANVKIDYREKLSQAQYVFYSYMINKFDLDETTPDTIVTNIISRGIEWKIWPKNWKPEGKSSDLASYLKEKIKSLRKNLTRQRELKDLARKKLLERLENN